MKRTITYKIEDDSAGLTIYDFLKKKRYSAQNITNLKKMPINTVLNDKFVHMSEIVRSGDILKINISEHSDKKIKLLDRDITCFADSDRIQFENFDYDSQADSTPISVKILYEDDDIIVVDKPYDMPTHQSMGNYENTLANVIATHLNDEHFIFRCSNRLDKNTTGVTVVAKHMIAASVLSLETRNREISRTYLAICHGKFDKECGTVDAPIARCADGIIKREVNFDKGERAVTHYEVLSYSEDCDISLVKLNLETGRTHQIRVHMSHIGHPLVGDDLYGGFKELHLPPGINEQSQSGWKRTCPQTSQSGSKRTCPQTRHLLMSYEMKFTHPITGEKMCMRASAADDMKMLIDIINNG